jgi:hypothetical protein
VAVRLGASVSCIGAQRIEQRRDIDSRITQSLGRLWIGHLAVCKLPSPYFLRFEFRSENIQVALALGRGGAEPNPVFRSAVSRKRFEAMGQKTNGAVMVQGRTVRPARFASSPIFKSIRLHSSVRL